MKIIDLADPKRVDRTPDQIKTIFSSGQFHEQGIVVKKVELRLYIEKKDKSLGDFSLITSFVDTSIGSIEMLYDEGFRGEDSLNRAATFLQSNLGISSLILRSIIALKQHTNS